MSSKYKIGLTEKHDEEAAVLIELKAELYEKFENEKAEALFQGILDNKAKAFQELSLFLHPDKNEDNPKKDDYALYFRAITEFRQRKNNEKEIQEGIKGMIQDPVISKALMEKYQKARNLERKEKEEARASEAKSQQENAERMQKVKEKSAREFGERKSNEGMPKFMGMLFKSVQEEYKSVSANFAQSIKSNTEKRGKQTDYIDQIKEQLKADKIENQNRKEPDKNFEHNEAKILYAVLALLEKDLKNEFRWTRWLGTQSRLENIVRKDMATIKEEFSKTNKSKITDGSEAALAKFAKKHPNLEMKKHFADINENREQRNGPEGP